MSNARSFGRRASTQPASQVARAPIDIAPPKAEPIETTPEPEPEFAPVGVESFPRDSSVDDELREWKKARGVKVPWRQLCLVASLSFGVASVVLTGEVADAVNWLLYALSAASLYFWWTGKAKPAR